jgi:16S rRNA (uracil1498-N3)-methyltransferase
MKPGDRVLVCTEKENSYLVEITGFSDNKVILTIVEERNEQVELPLEITIAQGVIRREKTEEVIRRISELGANFYLPVMMERSLVKIKEQDQKKTNRYQMIAKEASEQSQRTRIMKIEEPVSFDKLLASFENYDLCLVAYEKLSQAKDYNLEKNLRSFTGKSIIVIIGPEGGFSPQEIKLLQNTKAKFVGLGPRILRTETAPLYVMSVISYQFEEGETDEN